MKTYNVSMMLQIALDFKKTTIVAVCVETKSVVLFHHVGSDIAVIGEITKECELIDEPKTCKIITRAGKIDDVTGEIIPSEDPMYHMVGTGTFNKTNVKKAYSMIRSK